MQRVRATSGRNHPKFDRRRAGFGRALPKFSNAGPDPAESWPSSAQPLSTPGRSWPTSAELAPTLAGSGQTLDGGRPMLTARGQSTAEGGTSSTDARMPASASREGERERAEESKGAPTIVRFFAVLRFDGAHVSMAVVPMYLGPVLVQDPRANASWRRWEVREQSSVSIHVDLALSCVRPLCFMPGHVMRFLLVGEHPCTYVCAI